MEATNKSKVFRHDVRSYTVWTSDLTGDLFRANSVVVDNEYVCFYHAMTEVKKYPISEFVKNNPELFQGITIK